MKYAVLPLVELEKLEKKFIDFLVLNGIIADDWVSIKSEKPTEAQEIICQFSDVVWESVLRDTSYLNKIEENIAYYFKCNAQNIELIKITKNGPSVLKQTATKEYIKTRELELFDMMRSGCTKSDGEDYKKLLNL